MTHGKSDSLPRETGRRLQISLVIPVRNEEKSLPRLISSIRAQTFPPAEVVLVDGGSADRTLAVAQDLTTGDDRFRLIAAGDATPGRGRNVGIAAAKFGWIALTDAGIHLEPTWLERLAEVVSRDPGVAVVYGNYEPVKDTFFERCAALAYPAPKRLRPGGLMRGPFIASSLLQREVWEKVGGFPDLRAAEDLIFMERVRESGAKLGWAPTATVRWQLQPTLGRTFRKFALYSMHNVKAGWQRHWHYGLGRQYLAGLLFVILSFAFSPWWLVIPLAGFVARVAKSIWIRREGGGLKRLLDPVQFLGVAIILLTIDLATFVGWGMAIGQRRHGLSPDAKSLSVAEAGGGGHSKPLGFSQSDTPNKTTLGTTSSVGEP